MLLILFFNPAIIAFSTALGLLFCRILGIDPHVWELLAAAAICVVSTEIGVLPMALRRNGKPDALFQAGFLGTVLHLLLAAGLTAVMIFGLNASNAFAYWMLGLYWMSLLGLCWVIARKLRGPDVGSSAGAGSRLA